ncbi:hypothetical protein ABZ318_11485 [Streptomyces sp. NPDC006197]|uniref:hypothetical protein n=1 Tax=Streptomyces sp. NPDC006197 TaxID=3156685 RepID=UPI0033B19E59
MITAFRSAARWAARNRNPDGSWAVWQGTAEETAYAAQILLRSPDRPPAAVLVRARAHLAAHAAGPGGASALWHDKTLSAPSAVIRAEVLATLHQLTRHLADARDDAVPQPPAPPSPGGRQPGSPSVRHRPLTP